MRARARSLARLSSMPATSLLRLAAVGALCMLAACASRGTGDRGPLVGGRRGNSGVVTDVAAAYQRAGLLASASGVPFIGTVSVLAGPTADSTLVLVSLSLANQALTFSREGDVYRAAYEASVELRRGDTTVRRLSARDTVRVAGLREISRSEESVVFQQTLLAPPGSFAVSVSVRDIGGTRSGSASTNVTLPRFGARGIASPVLVYEATGRGQRDSAPTLVVNPRATALFGRDSVVPLYLEAYGPESSVPVQVVVRGDAGRVLARDSVVLRRTGRDVSNGMLRLPVSRLGVGALRIQASTTTDSASVPMLVGIGEGMLVTSFDELVSYLRYFAPPEQLRTLRDTVPEQRAAAWATFVRATDPNMSTPENEALREYFQRIELANLRFRDEGEPGWLTDRGMVLATLGEPDETLEPTVRMTDGTTRRMAWVYRQLRVQLIFVDQSGFGRWRLTPASESEFRSAARRFRSSGTE